MVMKSIITVLAISLGVSVAMASATQSVQNGSAEMGKVKPCDKQKSNPITLGANTAYKADSKESKGPQRTEKQRNAEHRGA
jgi:hypothetical protein